MPERLLSCIQLSPFMNDSYVTYINGKSFQTSWTYREKLIKISSANFIFRHKYAIAWREKVQRAPAVSYADKHDRLEGSQFIVRVIFHSPWCRWANKTSQDNFDRKEKEERDMTHLEIKRYGDNKMSFVLWGFNSCMANCLKFVIA